MTVELGFENLDVWKRSVKLSSEIYLQLKGCKDYGFKDQITRSSLSVPSNISEGYERFHKKEKHQFYSIAKGSAGELRTQCIIGKNILYIKKETADKWITELKEISSMINGLMKSVRQ